MDSVTEKLENLVLHLKTEAEGVVLQSLVIRDTSTWSLLIKPPGLSAHEPPVFMVNYQSDERFRFRVEKVGRNDCFELYNNDEMLARRLVHILKREDDLSLFIGSRLKKLRDGAQVKQASLSGTAKTSGEADSSGARWPIVLDHAQAESDHASQSYVSKVETGRKRIMLSDVRRYLRLLHFRCEFTILKGDRESDETIEDGFGPTIAKLRKERECGQEILAARIFRTQSAVSKMERRTDLAVDEFRNMLHGLGYSMRIVGKVMSPALSALSPIHGGSSSVVVLNEEMAPRLNPLRVVHSGHATQPGTPSESATLDPAVPQASRKSKMPV